MSKKSSKIPPQQHKTPEQLKKEQADIAEANRQRRLVVEKMYPILLKCSKNISDAQVFLTASKNAIEQKFNSGKYVKTIDEIKVLDDLDPNAPNAAAYREFIELFRYEKVFTAERLIEGMGNAIESFLREEFTKRKLDTLKTDFLPFTEE